MSVDGTSHGVTQWVSFHLANPLPVSKYGEREGGSGGKELLSAEKDRVKYIIFTLLSTVSSESAAETRVSGGG